ncbi:MAG: hypothetical protein ACM3TN_06585 [Alphaproteobacteria bacterium]
MGLFYLQSRMKLTRRYCARGMVAAGFLVALGSACSFGPGNIETRHSTDIAARKIRRIAIIPPAVSVDRKTPVPFTSTPVDSKPSERDASELLARQLYSIMDAQPGWQIISDREVAEVGQTLGSLSEGERLRRLGELVYADAVVTAQVRRYRERIGNEVGAKSPASVAFVLDLVDVRRGDVVWSARFDETQKPLSENIFAIGDISQRGIRWLRADQLMLEGVKKAVNQLHQVLVPSS